MPHRSLILISCLIAVGYLVAALAAVAGDKVHTGESPRPRFKLPKLFDFELYKRAFGKKYDSVAVELSRKRLYFARAFRAFVSRVKYQFRRMGYFLGINRMSDRSREEREKTLNRAMMADPMR